MKKYIKPDMNVELFDIEDVITTSGDGNKNGRSLTKMVNGNEGIDYGSQEMTIFID